jgi:hypothetical protein
MKLIRVRILIYAIGTTMLLARPVMADLRAARSFAVLSAAESVTFKDRDNVNKAVIPEAVTCPAGSGCRVHVGGKRISVGQDDQINAEATTALGDAGVDARAYATSLDSLPATQAIPAIALEPGSSTTITATAGLNVISVASVVAGTTEKHDPDRCWTEHREHGEQGATITISGSSAAMVILNVGTSKAPGFLTLCEGSKVLLAGGITPDKVVFNLVGPGKPARLGEHTTFNGTILALQREITTRGDAGERSVVNGALLAGGEVEIGDYVDINFYPLSQFGTPVTVDVIGTVEVQKLPPPPSHPREGEADEFLPAPHIEEPRGKPSPPMASTSLALTRDKQIDVLPGTPDAEDPTLTMPFNFRGLNQSGFIPSDTQLAAGRTRLLQMVNDTGAFYGKLAGNQIRTFDLGQFFLGPVGQGTDPRVLFDASTNTYFAAYELNPAGGDDIRLAVAQEPGDRWTVYRVRANNTNLLFDQPKLGVSLNKVILSWNEYDKSVSPKKFTGADYIVLQKSALISRAGSVPGVFWGPDSGRFQIIPVQSLSADGGNHFASDLAVDSQGNANIHLMTFMGEPGVSNVTFSDDSFAIGTVSAPPLALQPAGGDANVQTNDTRLLSAVWQNNRLWAAFNEGCTPPGDVKRACERFVQMTTDKAGVAQHRQLGSSGQDLYFGAVTLNRNDDLFFGFTLSSPSQNPAGVVAGVPGGSFGAVTGAIIYQSGAQAYVCGRAATCPRWGDYSGAARDPNDTTMGWVVQQFGGLAAPAAGNWGTGIAAVFFAPGPSDPSKACLQGCQDVDQQCLLACRKERDDCNAQIPHTPAACASAFRLCTDGCAGELAKCNGKCPTPTPTPTPTPSPAPTPTTTKACLDDCENSNQERELACKRDRDDCQAQVPHTPAACVSAFRTCMDGSARELKKCKAKCP